VRHQVALSASHQPQEYVALAFGRTPVGTVATCAPRAHRLAIDFDVTSHLSDPRDVRYVVTVADHRTRGSVTVDPGATARVSEVVRRPARKAYEVHVRLPDEDREVFAHCGPAS
jgi:hypothetical protein